MVEKPPPEEFFKLATSAIERQIDRAVDALCANLRHLAQRSTAPDEPSEDTARRIVHDWHDEAWTRFPPTTLPGYTSFLRVGTAHRDATQGLDSYSYAHPALVPLLGRGNLILRSPAKCRQEAVQSLQSAMLRLLATTAPGRVRFTLIDAAGFGQSFAPMMAFPDVVRGAMAWHNPRDIEREIATLTDRLATVVQKRLGNEFASIVEYNRAAGVSAEAYRVLAIANLPTGINERLWGQIISLAESGPRAGIHIMATLCTDDPLPPRCNEDDLLRHTVALHANDHGQWTSSQQSIANARIVLDIAEQGRAEAIAKWVTDKGRHADRIRIDFATLVPDLPWPGRLPRHDDDAIEVPIGRYGARDVQMFRIHSGTSQHVLVGGMAGSGKSVLLHVLILGLALKYRPIDLDLYLIDLKEGVEFAPYAGLPHARVVAIDTEPEFALSVLNEVKREMERRGTEFNRNKVNDFRTWHAKELGPMPAVLLIVDEFQVMLNRSDRTSATARLLLDDLVRRGRGFGIHVVLATQSLASVELETSTLSQLGVRIALRMPDSDSFRILAKDNDAAAHLERPGQALYNDASGQRGRDKPFQVAYLTRDECESRAASLAASARSNGWTRTPIVFDGAAPASMERDRALLSALTTPVTTLAKAVPLYLGEPLAVNDRHTQARLRRQGRSNLLILGTNEDESLATFAAACISACVFSPEHSLTLHLIDLTNADSVNSEALDDLTILHQNILLSKINQRRSQPAIDALSAEVDIRHQEEKRARPTTILAIFGIQRLHELHKAQAMPSPLGKQLSRILQNGPDVGIHSIVAVDAESSLNRIFDSKDLEMFESRVGLRGGDSVRIFGDHVMMVRSLRPRYGVFIDLETPNLAHKFKCYDMPGIAALLASWGKHHRNNREET